MRILRIIPIGHPPFVCSPTLVLEIKDRLAVRGSQQQHLNSQSASEHVCKIIREAGEAFWIEDMRPEKEYVTGSDFLRYQ